jgi:hypothetical protein
MYEVEVKRYKVYVNGKECSSLHSEENYQSGGFRWIHRTPDNKIIKLDYSTQYSSGDPLYKQCKAEVELYSVISSADKRYFPKILASGVRGKKKAWWLIEENLQLDPRFRVRREHAKIVRDLKRKYNIGDIYPRAGRSNHNWGVTKRGRIVIYDFGCNAFNCGVDYD